MEKQTGTTRLFETANKLLEKAGPGSKTAAMIAGYRFDESRKPEDERIYYDPYAVYFVPPEVLEFNKDPSKAKAVLESLGDLGVILTGFVNSIHARIRYFDDFVKKSVEKGISQLVILGAGYDTRAYRIECLSGKNNIKVIEVDRHATQDVKKEKIKEIFSGLPGSVVYVSIDLMTENLGEKLLRAGYDKSKQTLFLMEGLLMYLQPETVDGILCFIAGNSGKGSAIIFDYYPKSVIDGSSELELGRITHHYLMQMGEPLMFGIEGVMIEEFLTKRGFSQVCNVTSDDYKRICFQGKNENRAVSSILSFAHAVVE